MILAIDSIDGFWGNYQAPPRKPEVPSSRCSLGNSSVHSLSVTLGNHAFHDFQTYNWPCPVGHLPISKMTFRDLYPGTAPSVQRVRSQLLG
jgi:hypothetical protein